MIDISFYLVPDINADSSSNKSSIEKHHQSTTMTKSNEKRKSRSISDIQSGSLTSITTEGK